MKILYHPKFKKQYKKLPAFIQNLAEEKEILFRKNPFDSKLHTHKLQGKLNNFWPFRVDYNYRIILEFLDKNNVLFYQIGTHNIY